MKISIRPPSNRMIEKLKDCFEKELNGGEKTPCLPEEMKSSLAGLYKRGLIDTRMDMVNNKKQLCIYVTETGKRFLKELEEVAGKSK